eukprot:200375_1
MGNENSKQIGSRDTQQELETFEKLMSMGFNEHKSWDATKKYKGNILKAINYLTKQNESQNNLQNETDSIYETKYNSSHIFDKHIGKTDISHNANEEDQTAQNIANKIILIYKKLLTVVSANTCQHNTEINSNELYNEYYEKKK